MTDTHQRRFLAGSLFGVLLFLAINLLAAHVMSDCGLPSWLGLASCSDDIARAGWPFKFLEVGGFGHRLDFSGAKLAADVSVGAVAGGVSGWLVRRRPRRRA